MSNELLSTVSADEARRLAELLECGMGCGPTERRAATTLRALVLERDVLEGELAVLEEVQWQDKQAALADREPTPEMVNRFLQWELPADFNPDCGISFKPESEFHHREFGRTKYKPTGTNLLNYEQAREMLRYVLTAETPSAPTAVEPDEWATCEWTLEDDDNGTWQSSCGELWQFIEGGPKENRVSFCHNCGKPAIVRASKGTP